MFFTFLQYVFYFEPVQVSNYIPSMELYTNHLKTIFEGDFIEFYPVIETLKVGIDPGSVQS
jgi:hypothetical protein